MRLKKFIADGSMKSKYFYKFDVSFQVQAYLYFNRYNIAIQIFIQFD